jgi:hypothetical protein
LIGDSKQLPEYTFVCEDSSKGRKLKVRTYA